MFKKLIHCNQIFKNNRPKGPHNMQQISMCHLSDGSARVTIFVYWLASINTNLVGDVEILLPVKFCWIPWSGFRWEVENVSANQTQRPGRHLVFLVSPKNTNLIENVEIMLYIKFHWILFSGFWGEVENVSVNQRPRPPSCFFWSARKTQTW